MATTFCASLAVAALLLVQAPLPGTVGWTRSFHAPFMGSDWTGDNVTGTGLALSNYSRPTFNFTSGVGIANGTLSGSSSFMPCPSRTTKTYCTNLATVVGSFFVGVYLPFKNLSGTRTLDAVNLTLGFTIRANVTFVSGNCPWVKATKKSNECLAGSVASAGVTPGHLAYANGKNSTVGYCSSNCFGSAAGGSGVSLGVGEINSSSGLKILYGSNNSSASIITSGKASILYDSSAHPLRHSGKILLTFTGYIEDFFEFQAKTGAGGLVGASASESITFSVVVLSLVES